MFIWKNRKGHYKLQGEFDLRRFLQTSLVIRYGYQHTNQLSEFLPAEIYNHLLPKD